MIKYCQRANQIGFTLLELMVAISITAVIGIISATMLFGMIENHSQVLKHEKQLTAIERTLHIIKADIDQIALRPFIKPIDNQQNQTQPIDNNQLVGEFSSLAFTRYHTAPGIKGLERSLVRVRYSLDNNKFIRESINTDLPDVYQNWSKSTLLYEVDDLTITYFFKQWASSTRNENAFPKAIKVSLNTTRFKDLAVIGLLSGVDQ